MTDGRSALRRRSRASRAAWALFYLLLDAPVVAGVVVGLLAAYVSWDPLWWSQLVAIGMPYLAWPLAGLGLVCLLGRRWVGVGVHVLLLGVLVVRAGGPGRFSDPVPGPDDLRVVSFNIPQVGPSGEVLADSVASFVRATAPDVLLLQDAAVRARVRGRTPQRTRVEVDEPVQVGAVRRQLGYALPLPPAPRERGAKQRVEVPILLRDARAVEVVDQEVIQTGGADADGSQALRTHLRWQGREAVVYNVHLRSFGAEKPWDDPAVSVLRPRTWAPYLRRYRGVYAQREREAAEIAGRIAGEALPVIVAGDFNSTADNRSYHRLRTAGGVGRIDAMQAVGGGRWGRTYHAEQPFVRIDYVLVDPAFEVVAAGTRPVTFSDHRPVVVDLRWRAE